MKLTLRRVRLRAPWLLVAPFLWLARPTPTLLVAGGALALVGLALRAWAAGVLEKDRGITTSGPYARTRNPLYLGSLLMGLGACLAGGHWLWPVLFTVLYAATYVPTMRKEAKELGAVFGDEYGAYAAAVPTFLPGRVRGSGPPGGGVRFSWGRYARNREWEAALGAVALFAVLLAKAA